MARRYSTAIALLFATTLLLAQGRSQAHVVLDGETAQPILADIAKYLGETKGGAVEEAGAEALYLLGERVDDLVERMNLDVTSHGKSLYAELLVKRLHEYGIRITLRERSGRYAYDLVAFHEYLKRAPQGPRAADVRFRLIAEAFYGSVGRDAVEMVDIDLEGLRKAIQLKERFLKEHPKHEKVKEVRFFLAIDYYRFHKNSRDPATAKKYEELSARGLQEIVKDYPGTAEARAAAITLERLQRPGQKN